ncbi:hypothetical protein [Methylobacterium radiodurans]|uniref:Uncharacterized protein n=1 Tax=Methylobacterium radiodurans TaxID=2202828 RepID=A0A2U8W0J9_9HYPH|nr:hypothetical protein [Methylobacterium radiodurans]AWN38982.1 hypothetical protein DK427_12575 [Methylobacterium radiodurans]
MPFDRTDDEPAPARLPLLGLSLKLAAACGAVALLALLARGRSEAPPVAPEPSAAEAPFVPSAVAAPARTAAPSLPGRLGLDEPEAIDPVRLEPVRLNPVTGLREETLARGDFDAIESSALRLTLAREAGGEAPSLFVTLVRRGADGPGIAVVRTGIRGRIDTKFGPIVTLEATLAGAARRVCTGFATLTAAPLRIDGWLCAPLAQPPEPRALACALDALTLEGADGPAADLFRAAETRRDPGCRPPQPSAAADPPVGRTGSIRARRAAAGRG